MRHAGELPPKCPVEMRMIVAVQIGPNGGVRIQVGSTANVFQNCSPTVRQNNGFLLEPVLHLREGMPDEFLIESGKVGFHGKARGFTGGGVVTGDLGGQLSNNCFRSAKLCPAVTLNLRRAESRATVG